jgi:hypothetical protein
VTETERSLLLQVARILSQAISNPLVGKQQEADDIEFKCIRIERDCEIKVIVDSLTEE